VVVDAIDTGRWHGDSIVSGAPRCTEFDLVSCHTCRLVCTPAVEGHGKSLCPRCGSTLHRRHPDSISRSWAFLMAALLCYIPANALPVMYTSMLGSGSDSTILQGIVEFWKTGSYGIAVIIFIASVGVPCAKLLSLGLLLVTTQRRSRWAMRERTRLYRMIEQVGYWSMLDVMVVAMVAALVKFNALSDVEPRAGILFFGMVVIFTMLSAKHFDPRLIWDAEEA
jgi:paraquat-inducible protein A